MAHKSLIGGTAYEVTGGKTLVNGTGYDVAGGKTLVSGTGYDVSFTPAEMIIYDGGDSILAGTLSGVRNGGTNSSSGNNTTSSSEAIPDIVSGVIQLYGVMTSTADAGMYAVNYAVHSCSIGPIDFTDYETLHVEATAAQSTVATATDFVDGDIFGYSANPVNTSFPLDGSQMFSTASEMDISDISGEQYIRITAAHSDTLQGNHYVNVSKIYLT